MVECKGKHTKFQPSDDQWKCPACGSEDFEVDVQAYGAHSDCQLLHLLDSVVCYNCGESFYGEDLAEIMKKLGGFKRCPRCNGLGLVPVEGE